MSKNYRKAEFRWLLLDQISFRNTIHNFLPYPSGQMIDSRALNRIFISTVLRN